MTTQQIQINLGNVGSEDQAKRIKSKIQGKSYYDFQVWFSPDAGNWPVFVTTDYEGAEESEAREMLLFILACEM